VHAVHVERGFSYKLVTRQEDSWRVSDGSSSTVRLLAVCVANTWLIPDNDCQPAQMDVMPVGRLYATAPNGVVQRTSNGFSCGCRGRCGL